nr:MAG TPA: hypothetical protein [Caudoviricetes sp.]
MLLWLYIRIMSSQRWMRVHLCSVNFIPKKLTVFVLLLLA